MIVFHGCRAFGYILLHFAPITGGLEGRHHGAQNVIQPAGGHVGGETGLVYIKAETVGCPHTSVLP